MPPEQIDRELRALYQEGAQLAALHASTGVNADQAKRAKEIRARISELKSMQDEAGAIDFADFRSGHEALTAPAGTRAAARQDGAGGRDPNHGGRNESGTEARSKDGAEAIEWRSVGERFIESEAFKKFRDDRSAGDSAAVEVGTFFGPMNTEFRHRRGMSPEETRTLISIGALPTNMAPVQRVPGIFVPDLREFSVRSAWLNGQTTAGSIEFFRELLYTNNAAFVAEATATAGASGLKPESALTFERDTATIETLAHWVAITNQTIEDVPQMLTIVEGRLVDGLRDVEDDALMNGDGSGANILGFRQNPDIQVLDAAYFATNPVQDVDEDNENFNRILRARRLSRQVGRGRPSAVFLHPEDVEGFLTATDANRQYMGGGPFNGLTIPRIWGLTVIETEAQDPGIATVVDGRAGAVWDRMAATVQIDTIDDQFVRNMRTVLAEERVGFTLYRPQTVVDTELAAWI